MKYLATAICLLSSMAFTATQSGTVKGYVPFSNGDKIILIFQIENNVKSGCNSTGRFAIDETSPRYAATLSAILAAYHSQTRIKVNYLDTCNAWGNSADVNFICVGDVLC